jgi:undecaprenyl pyrophosphate phosphatase UppP
MSKLVAYDNVNIVLTLPDGVTVSQMVWFSVWCKQATVSSSCVIVLFNNFTHNYEMEWFVQYVISWGISEMCLTLCRLTQ